MRPNGRADLTTPRLREYLSRNDTTVRAVATATEQMLDNFASIRQWREKTSTAPDPESDKWGPAVWAIVQNKTSNILRTITRCGDFYLFFGRIGRYAYYTDGKALSVEFMNSTMRASAGKVSCDLFAYPPPVF